MEIVLLVTLFFRNSFYFLFYFVAMGFTDFCNRLT